ncbi:MAG: pilus assembly protein TadG-related protein [Lapillicoccus sp.]
MTLLTVILMSVVLLGITSLVVDLGLARDTRRQAQNAADSAALAAGNSLATGGSVITAVATAKSLAQRNFGTSAADWAACTDAAKLAYVPPAGTPCISFDSGTPTAVRVLVPVRPVLTPFAGIWGNSSVPVQAAAKVGVTSSNTPPCGFCVIGEGTHNLQNGDISVKNTSVDINGTLTTNPGASITVVTGATNLEGAAPSQGTFSPPPTPNQPPIADPLASLVFPDLTGKVLSANQNSCTGGPGVYKTLTLNCPTATPMQPGLYIVTGDTSFSGNDHLDALGVTIYLTCAVANNPNKGNPRVCASTGEDGAGFKTAGNGSLTITAPTTGATKGIAILSDRNNTSTLTYRGNGITANTGTVYAKTGTLDYRGNGAGIYDDSMIVVGDFSFSGTNPLVQVTYTQANNAVLPMTTEMHLAE